MMRALKIRMLRVSLMSASAAAITVAAVTPAVAQAQVRNFDIPAQPLSSALLEFSRQSDVLIVVAPELTEGKRSPTLRASLPVNEAIGRLLRGSGLRAAPNPRGGYRIERITVSNGEGSPGSGEAQAAGAAADSESAEDLGAEIVVTGTLIPGATPVGADLRTYTRDDIDRTGATTIQEFARTLPQNFANTDTISTTRTNSGRGPGGAISNSAAGSAFNLRGLGPSATLTLLNGSRLAPGSADGTVFDISLIPLSAVSRVEVLADGASALYGSDAVAGVVNIITRDDFEGLETRAHVGTSTDGGATRFGGSVAAGVAWSDGNIFAAIQYDKQRPLDAADRDYIPDQGSAYFVLPEGDTVSAFLSGSQQLTQTTRLRAHTYWSSRNTTFINNSNLPTFNLFSLSENGSDVRQSGLDVALEQEMWGDWTARLSGTYSRIRQNTLSRNQTLRPNPSLQVQPEDDNFANISLRQIDILLSGSLVYLRSGPVKVAVGGSQRSEELTTRTAAQFFNANGALTSSTSTSRGPFHRDVWSGFGEIRVPIIGEASPLDVSAAIRWDSYDDIGEATTYKFGANWTPFPGLRLRGTYGSSFRAPTLPQIYNPITASVVRAGTQAGAPPFYISVGGGNPDLGPERADTFTAGLDLTPQSAPGLRLNVTYYNVDFRDRISGPPSLGNAFTNPIGSRFITLSPSLDEVQYFYALVGFSNPLSIQPQQIGAIFDPRLTNLSSVRQSGVDVNLAYRFSIGRNQISTDVSVTHVLKNRYKILPEVPSVDYVNTFASPLRWRGRGSINWNRGGFNASIAVNYANEYRNGLGVTAANPSGSPERIDAWITGDLQISYRLNEGPGPLRGMQISLTVTNLTDAEPPRFIFPPGTVTDPQAPYIPYDSANASPLGRFISLQLIKRW